MNIIKGLNLFKKNNAKQPIFDKDAGASKEEPPHDTGGCCGGCGGETQESNS